MKENNSLIAAERFKRGSGLASQRQGTLHKPETTKDVTVNPIFLTPAKLRPSFGDER